MVVTAPAGDVLAAVVYDTLRQRSITAGNNSRSGVVGTVAGLLTEPPNLTAVAGFLAEPPKLTEGLPTLLFELPRNMTAIEELYDKLCGHVRTTSVLESVNALLAWDERTKLPKHGTSHRATQMSTLAGMIHQRRTDPHLGEWLSKLEDSELAVDVHSDTGATLRAIRRDYDKDLKLPQSLVEALARATVEGQQVWQQARESNRFADFAPKLTEIMQLVCEKADALGHDGQRYDGLLDEFEPGAKTEEISRVLADLADRLSPLIAAIAKTGRSAPIEILQRDYNVGHQTQFGRRAASQIGFDFDRGRLDVTSHPFCESAGPDDCRISTLR